MTTEGQWPRQSRPPTHAPSNATDTPMYARDNNADCVVVGNSGARGDVHHGRRGADEVKGNADNTIC